MKLATFLILSLTTLASAHAKTSFSCDLGYYGKDGEMIVEADTQNAKAPLTVIKSTYHLYRNGTEKNQTPMTLDFTKKVVSLTLSSGEKLSVDISKEAVEYPKDFEAFEAIGSYLNRSYLGTLTKKNGSKIWATCNANDIAEIFGVFRKPYSEHPSRTPVVEKDLLYSCTPSMGSFSVRVNFYGEVKNSKPVVKSMKYHFGKHAGKVDVTSKIIKLDDGKWLEVNYNDQISFGIPFPEEDVTPTLFDGSIVDLPNVGKDALINGNGMEIRVRDGLFNGLSCNKKF